MPRAILKAAPIGSLVSKPTHHPQQALQLLDLVICCFAFQRRCLTLPVDAFDMTSYYGADDPDGDPAMGMAADAAGCAALHPWFQERGLTMKHGDVRDYFSYAPCYGGKESSEAIAAFFGITDEEQRYVFDGSSYGLEDPRDITIRMVSSRIRSLIDLYRRKI